MNTAHTKYFALTVSLISFALPGFLMAEEGHVNLPKVKSDLQNAQQIDGWKKYDSNQDGVLSDDEQNAMTNELKDTQDTSMPEPTSESSSASEEDTDASTQEEGDSSEVEEMKAHQKSYDDRAENNSPYAVPEGDSEPQLENINTPEGSSAAKVNEMKEHQKSYDDRASDSSADADENY